MLACVPSSDEAWLEFEPQSSPAAEAARLAALVEEAGSHVAAGARRIWLCSSEGSPSPNESLRLALSVMLQCEGLSIVAVGLRVPHWIRFAEDVATADGLCGGRLEIGFAAPPPPETIECLRQAWSGAPVAVAGGDPIRIHPRPVRPDGPPLWTSVMSEADAGAAAQCELGAIVHPAATIGVGALAAGSSLPLAVFGAPAAEAPPGLPPDTIVLSRTRSALRSG